MSEEKDTQKARDKSFSEMSRRTFVTTSAAAVTAAGMPLLSPARPLEIAVVVDRDTRSRSKEFSRLLTATGAKSRITVFDSATMALASLLDPRIDGTVVATEPSSQLEIAGMFARAGKAVYLTELPNAPVSREHPSMAAGAIVQAPLFDRSSEALTAYVARVSTRIGRVDSVRGYCVGVECDIGAIRDHVVQEIDVARCLLRGGTPSRVAALPAAGLVAQSRRTRGAQCIADYENGRQLQFAVKLAADTRNDPAILGDPHALVLGHRVSGSGGDSSSERFGVHADPPGEPATLRERHLANWLDATRANSASVLYAPLHDVAETLRVWHAVAMALSTGRAFETVLD